MRNKAKEVVMAIGDLHTPFEHPDAVRFLKWAKDKYKPTKVVCMGDEIDAHALSNYDTDPDGLSAGDEMKASLKHLEPIYKLFPNVMVCTSNHTARPYRKAFQHGIPKLFLKDYKEFLKAPAGWDWKDCWEVDDVRYEHGEAFGGREAAIKSALANMQSTVIGHIHAYAGIQYSANPKHLVFGFNVGCLINKDEYAFSYGNKIKSKPIIGVGIISKGVPQFIPMLLNKNGRWIKTK